MRTVEQMRAGEFERLQGIIDRNPETGVARACAFAAQTYSVYRAQLKMRPRKYAQTYRLELIVSCLVFREFLRAK
jgi:hypothetical protein